MEAALEQFGIDVTGMTCLDAGLSTGGFTDCLLQKGAVKVYGVDVGFGQVTPMHASNQVAACKQCIRLVRPSSGHCGRFC
jgi:predicted rRNA methylase YqxC with S4 and FtsJ domains